MRGWGAALGWLRIGAALLLTLVVALLVAATAYAAEPPSNVTLPSVFGTPKDELSVKSSKGTWSGTPPYTYSFKWSRCDTSGENCAVIAGAATSIYRVTHADVGHTLRSTVSAANEAGSAPATSPQSAVVVASAPAKKSLPKITGLKEDGQLLSASTGAWKGTPPFAYHYQWEACNSLGASCQAIEGATASTYRPLTPQIGGRLKAIVSATNGVGVANATSPRTSLIKAGPPVNAALPSISGTLQEGSTLTAHAGTWVGTGPINFAYQWLRCASSGGSCEQIPEAVSSTYSPTGEDLTHDLAVVVTGSNALASVQATSLETQTVVGILPTNEVLPTISGLFQDGQLLSVAAGAWSGTAPIAYTFQWQLCNVLGEACKNLSGATSSSLKLDPSEIGKTLDVIVTATNVAGATSVTTSVTSLIEGILPKNTALPSISGVLQDGQLLNVSPGSWTGSEPISYGYQWQLCNAAGEACENIEGATGTSLKLGSLDIGKTLDVVVTATNAAGSTSATTSVTELIAGILPKNTALPSISGVLEDGKLLSTSNGSWEGTTPLEYGYQWQLCNSAGKECKNIGGATGSSLKLEPADIGQTLAVVVTATNAAGSTSATSSVTGLILAILPKNTELPTISGVLKNGGTLTATTGGWSGTSPITYGYQWQLCLLSKCENIASATKSTLTLLPVDVGGLIRVIVTATNARGSTPATSKETTAIGL